MELSILGVMRWSAMVLCPRCEGAPRVIEMWGSYSDLAVGPGGPVEHAPSQRHPHGRRTRLPPEIRVHITWDGTSMLATRPRSRFVPQASGDHVFTGCIVPPIPSLSSKTQSCTMSPSTRENTPHLGAGSRYGPTPPTPPAGQTG